VVRARAVANNGAKVTCGAGLSWGLVLVCAKIGIIGVIFAQTRL